MEVFLWIIIITVVIFVLSGIKVVNQYERGVVLTLGRYTGLRDPGLRVVVPISSASFVLIFVQCQLTCQSRRLLRRIT